VSARIDADTQARFWDRIAPRYARSPIRDEESYRKKLSWTQAQLDPSMSILEIGCGTGGTAVEHARHVRQVVATDLSPAMIDIARKRALEAGADNIRFEALKAENALAGESRYDAVLALSLLHLVSDPAAVLDRIRRSLDPGGLLVASTPCLSEAAPWLRWVAPIPTALGLIPALRFFTRPELETWIRNAGFSIEQSWQPSARGGVFHLARLGT